jgi:hypothetical protein
VPLGVNSVVEDCKILRGISIKKIVISIILLTLIGCGIGASHFSYPLYTPQSHQYPQKWPLRVAIAFPEEGRKAPNRDVDLEPIITSRCKETPTYISPRLEISRGLLEELHATGAFQTVHWAPQSFDDYDLIIRMKLLDGGKRFESERCPALLGPWLWELVVTDQTGRALDHRTLSQGEVDIMSSSPVANYRKHESSFLLEAIKPVMSSAKQLMREYPNIEARRTLIFMERRAPELKSLRMGLVSSSKQSLDTGQIYLTKLASVEAIRQAEEAATEAHQKLDDKAWSEIQAQAGKELKALGEEVQQVIADSFNMLFSGLTDVSSLQKSSPQELLRAMENAKMETAQRVEAPNGLQSLLSSLPQDFLPKGAVQVLSDVNRAGEIVQSVQKTLQVPASDVSSLSPAANSIQSGCGKDTDCKGERICVNHECVEPKQGKE